MKHHALRLRAVIDETHDAKSLVFDVPREIAPLFAYRPGQFVTLRLPLQGRHVPRCYSMSSAPLIDDALRVTVKRVANGRGSNWVCDRLKAGDVVDVLPPAGVFTPRSLDDDLLLFAGGSGITPVYSILRSALAGGRGRIVLVYANRDERSVIFRGELQALAAAHPRRLQVLHWLDTVQGVPSVAQLAELARPSRDAQAFICGPGPFMDAAQAALQAIDMRPEAIHVERFASLPDEDDAAARSDTGAAGGIDHADLEITLDGTLHRIEATGRETVLDAALRAGLNVPYSCQAGLCASCRCQVVDGEVRLRHNEALDAKDLARGWTLACQAVPLSPRLHIRFPE